MHLYPVTQSIATDSHARAAEPTPADLDPSIHPIISKHWFGIGIEPPSAIDSITAETIASLRRQRATEHLHNLGPRPVLEALAEVEAGADLNRVLADFARLDPETVRQIGGDHFPPAPIYEVSQ